MGTLKELVARGHNTNSLSHSFAYQPTDIVMVENNRVEYTGCRVYRASRKSKSDLNVVISLVPDFFFNNINNNNGTLLYTTKSKRYNKQAYMEKIAR